uniref:Glutamate-1-semialdehyde 2,1-aminomutase n=1 Tax=Mucochytrium quahogii TaxID=96639 RepID=A0A7S2S0I1_9STRA
MSETGLYVSMLSATSFVALGAMGIIVSESMIFALVGTLLVVVSPTLNSKQSVRLIALLILLFTGYVFGEKENTLLVLYLASCGFMAKRVFVVAMTLRASTPASLMFPVISHIVPRWSLDNHAFFRADSPPEYIAEKREAAFEQLYKKWCNMFPKSIQESRYLADKFSDLRFCAGNRVFIPFQEKLSKWCDPCTVVDHADRTDLIDVDGHRLTDVSGSYGVNVCGYDAYKRFMSEGLELTKDVGCVLGPLHPLIRENIDMLREISGKDEISFHMSGTEAVMCAMRLVRFNTGKKYVVVFGGAYHGWWDGVQSLAGNERVPSDLLTLKDLSEASMDVIKLRSDEIAAVLVNPLQAFHPNAPPPSDLSLASNIREVSDSSKEYKRWLERMRQVCTDCNVALVFDEVYTGFRLAPGGAQEYFDVMADMVVYGKTLGGGIANGIVCGPRNLMCRTDPKKTA